MPSEKTKLTVTPSEVFKISKNSDGAMPSEMISKGPSEKSLLERVCEYKNGMALYIDWFSIIEQQRNLIVGK